MAPRHFGNAAVQPNSCCQALFKSDELYVNCALLILTAKSHLCMSGQLNHGLPRGRQEFYHWTTHAVSKLWNELLPEITVSHWTRKGFKAVALGRMELCAKLFWYGFREWELCSQHMSYLGSHLPHGLVVRISGFHLCQKTNILVWGPAYAVPSDVSHLCQFDAVWTSKGKAKISLREQRLQSSCLKTSCLSCGDTAQW